MFMKRTDGVIVEVSKRNVKKYKKKGWIILDFNNMTFDCTNPDMVRVKIIKTGVREDGSIDRILEDCIKYGMNYWIEGYERNLNILNNLNENSPEYSQIVDSQNGIIVALIDFINMIDSFGIRGLERFASDLTRRFKRNI